MTRIPRTVQLILLAAAFGCSSVDEPQPPETVPAPSSASHADQPADVWGAIERGDVAFVRGLLDRGEIDVNIRNGEGTTPLMSSVSHDNQALAELLLRYGAGINAADYRGYTALHRAAVRGLTDLASFLLTKGADPNVDLKSGGTPLMMAAAADFLPICRALLDAGAAIDFETPQGHTALYFASYNHNEDVVDLLRQYGADPSAHHQALLHVGAQDGNIEELLEGARGGADLDSSAPIGLNAVMLAAEAGNLDALRELLTRGAGINLHGADGNTALHFAVLNNHHEASKLLIDFGADPSSRNDRGQSALDLARSSGSVEIVSLIESKTLKRETGTN